MNSDSDAASGSDAVRGSDSGLGDETDVDADLPFNSSAVGPPPPTLVPNELGALWMLRPRASSAAENPRSSWKLYHFTRRRDRLYYADERKFVVVDERSVLQVSNVVPDPDLAGFTLHTAYGLYYFAAISKRQRAVVMAALRALVATVCSIGGPSSLSTSEESESDAGSDLEDCPVLQATLVEAVVRKGPRMAVILYHGQQKFTSWPITSNSLVTPRCVATFVFPQDSLRVQLRAPPARVGGSERVLGECSVDIAGLPMGGVIDDWFLCRGANGAVAGLVHLWLARGYSRSGLSPTPLALAVRARDGAESSSEGTGSARRRRRARSASHPAAGVPALHARGLGLVLLPLRVDSGDLVLLQYPHLTGVARAVLLQTQWTHVGLVVRARSHGAERLMLLEATMGGVQCRPLELVLRRLHSTAAVAVRRLLLPSAMSPPWADREAALQRFVRAVKGRPFASGLATFIKAGLHQHTEEERESYFCSQLVAAAYREMGVVGAHFISLNATPRDWATEGDEASRLAFQPGFGLAPKLAFGARSCTKLRPAPAVPDTAPPPLVLTWDEFRGEAHTLTAARRFLKLEDFCRWDAAQRAVNGPSMSPSVRSAPLSASPSPAASPALGVASDAGSDGSDVETPGRLRRSRSLQSLMPAPTRGLSAASQPSRAHRASVPRPPSTHSDRLPRRADPERRKGRKRRDASESPLQSPPRVWGGRHEVRAAQLVWHLFGGNIRSSVAYRPLLAPQLDGVGVAPHVQLAAVMDQLAREEAGFVSWRLDGALRAALMLPAHYDADAFAATVLVLVVYEAAREHCAAAERGAWDFVAMKAWAYATAQALPTTPLPALARELIALLVRFGVLVQGSAE